MIFMGVIYCGRLLRMTTIYKDIQYTDRGSKWCCDTDFCQLCL